VNPSIVSCTVTGPGMKSRPMASYCPPSQRAVQRARAETYRQRADWERAEAMTLLAQSGFEPQPPCPEMPAKLALWQQPDPILTPDFLLGVVTGAMVASIAVTLMLGGRS